MKPRFALLFVALNLAWESGQLPLYTLAWTEAWPRIVFAVLHCTAGDLIIGAAAFGLALVVGGRDWPGERTAQLQVIALTTAFGVTYTVFSEWANVSLWGNWAYTEWMPRLPLLGTGLSPVLQWLLLPPLTLMIARPSQPAQQPCRHGKRAGR